MHVQGVPTNPQGVIHACSARIGITLKTAQQTQRIDFRAQDTGSVLIDRIKLVEGHKAANEPIPTDE